MCKIALLHAAGLNSVVSVFAVGAFECSNSEAQAFKLFPNVRNIFVYIYRC